VYTVNPTDNGSIDIGAGAAAIPGVFDIGAAGEVTVDGSTAIDGIFVDGGTVTVGDPLDASVGTIVTYGGQLPVSDGGSTFHQTPPLSTISPIAPPSVTVTAPHCLQLCR
jgi:hypothetical protein